MSKGGKTKEGGKLDQQVDKVFTAAPEIALVMKDDLDVIHPVLRTERDVLMNAVVRPSYEAKGIETSAAPAGQRSTAAVLIVDNLSMSKFGRNHSRVMGALHWAATGLKWQSLIDSPRIWKQRHKERERQSKETIIYTSAVA